MELDFSKLNKLSFAEFTEMPPEKQPSKTPPEPLLGQGKYKSTIEPEKPATGLTEGLEGMAPLQRQADAQKAELERAGAVYREYQSNIKASSQLQTEILKGLQRGEDIYTLFLKAVKAISLMTSNKPFYTQSEGDLIAIYGKGLQQSKPLELELEQLQGRLQRLRDARSREPEADSRARIERAIKAHEAQEAQITTQIQQAQGGTAPAPESQRGA